ncbi:hypothetical protein RDT67_09115 [Serratia fonticola]|uniref:AzlD domain-containing protein n=1 Tax=Serratia fonticola TaxID=47917 RepID=A0AAJ1YDS2_SERFO|nr:hypothetical protein [Serratia fonticola]MDQ9126590.1 hypothetical protein [Serratia fonticola]
MDNQTLIIGILILASGTFAFRFAGYARLGGVAVGALLAWRKTPLIVVLLAAAAVTALLRVAGVA